MIVGVLIRTECARCERGVILATLALTREPGLFEAEDYPTETVPADMRYAYNRRTLLMDDLHTRPEHLVPAVCAIPHMCPVDLDALAERELERKRLRELLPE